MKSISANAYVILGENKTSLLTSQPIKFKSATVNQQGSGVKKLKKGKLLTKDIENTIATKKSTFSA